MRTSGNKPHPHRFGNYPRCAAFDLRPLRGQTSQQEMIMSVWNFVKDAGERIVENAKAAARFGTPQEKAEPAAATQKPTNGGNGKDAGEAIANYIRVQGLQVDNLKVSFDAPSSTVHVSGTAKDQATKEKV